MRSGTELEQKYAKRVAPVSGLAVIARAGDLRLIRGVLEQRLRAGVEQATPITGHPASHERCSYGGEKAVPESGVLHLHYEAELLAATWTPTLEQKLCFRTL